MMLTDAAVVCSLQGVGQHCRSSVCRSLTYKLKRCLIPHPLINVNRGGGGAHICKTIFFTFSGLWQKGWTVGGGGGR